MSTKEKVILYLSLSLIGALSLIFLEDFTKLGDLIPSPHVNLFGSSVSTLNISFHLISSFVVVLVYNRIRRTSE